MNKVITKIKEEMEKQGLTTPKMLAKVGITDEKEIRKTNRYLSEKTKKIESQWVSMVCGVLNISEDQSQPCGVAKVHRLITPEEENLLQILESEPDVRDAIKAMIALPKRKQKIYLGKMLEDLEEIEIDEKGRG